VNLPLEELIRFWNERAPRERNLLVVLILCLVLFVDYLLFMRPVQAIYADTLPQLGSLKQELRTLKQDRKNRDGIEKDWAEAKAKLAEAEGRFIEWHEMSGMLDRVSQLAQGSGVKIMSLAPLEIKSAQTPTRYRPIPVSLSGLGGAHAIGKFLSKLESDRTFFRITQLRIAENPSDVKRHLVELRFEVLRKGGA
jgi:Tfp pilus assembly protein PilO